VHIKVVHMHDSLLQQLRDCSFMNGHTQPTDKRQCGPVGRL